MLHKANAILSLFSADRPELAVVEIAELLDRPRSTVYRILGTMADAGFLDQDPVTGRYRVGMRLAMLGELARHSTSLQRTVFPSLLRLSETTGEMTSLMVPSGGEGVTVDVVESYHPLKIPGHLGGRFPLHATAGGKVLLAWRPSDDIERALGRSLERRTANTITSPLRLKRELESVRKLGYGVAKGEWLEDVYAVAGPVRDHRGQVVGALGVACPKSRWKQRHIRVMVDAVLAGAAAATRALGGSASDRPARERPRRDPS
jgi:DNA-binding IclR family transcriptional regulator